MQSRSALAGSTSDPGPLWVPAPLGMLSGWQSGVGVGVGELPPRLSTSPVVGCEEPKGKSICHNILPHLIGTRCAWSSGGEAGHRHRGP